MLPPLSLFYRLATVCRVRKFPGQTELTMSAEVELISTMVEKKSWTRAPIQMEFQVCGHQSIFFSISDIRSSDAGSYSTGSVILVHGAE